MHRVSDWEKLVLRERVITTQRRDPMQAQCNAEQLEFSCVERRRVVAAFDGGTVSSDAGALLLGRTDEAIGLIDRLAGCFIDEREPNLIEHAVRTLVGQRVFGMALGYEDLNDHESLRHDAVFGTLLGKLEPRRRSDCAALAGKSTLNRLELHESQGSSRYHKIRPDAEAIERLWVDLFFDAHREAPGEIILDLDATDDPLHGHQEGRFFHGYYDGYCYLPLYIFCGEHLLCAKLRRSNIDGAAGAREEIERIVGQIRQRRSGLRGASKNSSTARARAGAGLDGSWRKPSRPGTKPTRASSSLHYRPKSGRRANCMKIFTAPEASARTASRKRSSICLLIDSRPPRSAPTSCVCGSPRLPTCSCTRCAVSDLPVPRSRAPARTRSGCGC